MERPSIRQLECLVAVAEHLSFRRAAEACFITQPALSAQIRQLETNLGLKLFERDRRRVLTTAAGERLVEHARRVLAEADGFVEAAHVLDEPLVGELRMGVIPTVAPYVLPRAVAAVRRKYRRLKLLLVEDRTETLFEALRKGELDLALVALEVELGELRTRPLYRDPFLLALPRDHRLARRKTVREKDLFGEEVLLLEDGHCLRDQVLEVCRLGQADEVDDFRAGSLNTLVRMVAAGIGVTLLPGLAVKSEIHPQDNLALVPFASRAVGRTIGFVWRPTTARADEFELLARLFEKTSPRSAEAMP